MLKSNAKRKKFLRFLNKFFRLIVLAFCTTFFLVIFTKKKKSFSLKHHFNVTLYYQQALGPFVSHLRWLFTITVKFQKDQLSQNKSSKRDPQVRSNHQNVKLVKHKKVHITPQLKRHVNTICFCKVLHKFHLFKLSLNSIYKNMSSKYFFPSNLMVSDTLLTLA